MTTRIVPRNGRFEELASGRHFLPIGFHFIRHAPGFHYVIHPDHYDSELVRGVLFNLGLHEFNVLRIFLGGIPMGADGRVHPQVVANLVDVLARAKEHGVYLVLETVTNLPRPSVYATIADHGARADVGGPQEALLVDSHAHARAELIVDLLKGVQSRDPSALATLFSIELYNEMPVWPRFCPFVQTTGTFTYHDKGYDLSDKASRLRLLDEGVKWSSEVIVRKVREIDEHLMVGFSTLPPRTRGRQDFLDNMPLPPLPCVTDPAHGLFPIRPLAMARSSLSYIDIHYIDPTDFAALEWPELRNSGKPILCGEMGLHHMHGASAIGKLETLVANGVSGAVFWDYDREVVNGLSNSGEVFRSLSRNSKTYFLTSGGTTVAYSNGRFHAAFLSNDHRRMYDQLFGTATPAAQQGQSRGLMPVPEGYFQWNSTTYYSKGNGHFVGFVTQEAYDNHKKWIPNAPFFHAFDDPPARFMTEDFPPYSSYPAP